MKLLELRQAACENLAATYLGLGSATGQSEIFKEEEFTACVSNLVHPICNFAIDLDLSPWSAHRIAELAGQHNGFCVYHCPFDKPDHAPELLERAGFERAYGLEMMVADGREWSEIVVLDPVREPMERLEVARFMSDQFFSRQNEAFRRLVAEATASAGGLDLYQIWSGRQRVASLMLSEGEVLGLYNLCVHPTFRGLGWGISAVQSVLARAAETGRKVSLQCESRLTDWYRHLGFEDIGAMNVYDLAERRKRDIIL